MSDSSEDDDVAWLLARTKGAPAPSISPASAARYGKLEALISELPARPADAAPRPDWQDRVLAAIDAQAAGERYGATTGGIVHIVRKKLWLIGIVGAAVAAVLAWAMVLR